MASTPLKESGHAVARVGDLLAVHVDLRLVTADLRDAGDAVVGRGVDAGRELAEIHGVLDLAVIHPGLVDARNRPRDVDDVAVVTVDAADRADRREDLLVDRNVGNREFLKRRDVLVLGTGRGVGGRRRGRCGRRRRGRRRGLSAHLDAQGAQNAE
jgi:hypothetical protein